MTKQRSEGHGPEDRPPFLTPTFFPLEKVTLQDLRRWQSGQQKLRDFHWQWYFELTRQRSKVAEEIRNELRKVCIPKEFSGWRRSVRYKWSLNPLSAKGSLGVPGGRFNIGDIDESVFPKFPALYLAEDVDTALAEMIGPRRNPLDHLDEYELALAKEGSLTVVSVYGELESVIDLNSPELLRGFIDLIKDFEITDSLEGMAEELNINIAGGAVRTVDALMSTLLNPNWRQFPMHVDLPANSQIFGQLAFSAGVDGIVYPSKHTRRNCLSVFPQNLKVGDSFVEIMDADLPKGVLERRLDSRSWNRLI